MNTITAKRTQKSSYGVKDQFFREKSVVLRRGWTQSGSRGNPPTNIQSVIFFVCKPDLESILLLRRIPSWRGLCLCRQDTSS
jgi:hypothetical protein